MCIIKIGKFEKYGRLLGEIFINCKNKSQFITFDCNDNDLCNFKTNQSSARPDLLYVNGVMINETPCNLYEGKKKPKFLDLNQNFHSTYDPIVNQYKNQFMNL